jgi:hypothetical protein
MKKELVLNRYHLFTALKLEGKIVNSLQAGEAYEIDSPDKPYYLVKLWAFPQNLYYLCRNRDSQSKFTLFSKLMGEYESPTFRRPVGSGELHADLKTHLEIQFTFPRQRIFMSLYPAPTTIDSLLSQSAIDDEVEL